MPDGSSLPSHGSQSVLPEHRIRPVYTSFHATHGPIMFMFVWWLLLLPGVSVSVSVPVESGISGERVKARRSLEGADSGAGVAGRDRMLCTVHILYSMPNEAHNMNGLGRRRRRPTDGREWRSRDIITLRGESNSHRNWSAQSHMGW